MADNKLAKVGETGLAELFGADVASLTERPDFIPEGDKSGTEGITRDDIRLPRLGIAQGLSPQMIPGDNAYIPDLKMFQMFNDETKAVYGNGPLFFIPIRRDVRGIEFIPRSEGGGIKDMNVPRGDERLTKWSKDPETGKNVPPPATLFNEWIVLPLKSVNGRPELDQPIVISVKATNKFNRRACTDLNGFIKAHASQGKDSVPIYGVIYAISSKSEKNDNGTFGVPVFTQVGFIPKTRRDLYDTAKQAHDDFANKTVTINREAGDETDFPPVDGEVVQ